MTPIRPPLTVPSKGHRRVAVLVIAPTHDIATVQSNAIAYQIFDLLHHHPQIAIEFLGWWQSRPRNIRKHLRDHDYDLIIYFGHGVQDGWHHGFFGNFIDEQDAALFRGAIVYTMACHSAVAFGKQVCQHGAKAYIGNTHEVWGAFNMPEHQYGLDFAREWQNEIINLFRGVPVKDCVRHAKRMWRTLADQYRAHPNLTWNKVYAEKAEINYLVHHYEGHGAKKHRLLVRIWGATMRISPTEYPILQAGK